MLLWDQQDELFHGISELNCITDVPQTTSIPEVIAIVKPS